MENNFDFSKAKAISEVPALQQLRQAYQNNQQKNILIIGAGKLGLPLANRLKSTHQVTLVSRSQKPIDGVKQIVKDVKTLQPSDFGSVFDVVYVILSPDDRTVAGYTHSYVESVRPISQAVFSQHTHLIYISSTGVYGQNMGEIVDIHTTPNPTTPKDKCLYSAELLYQAFWQDNLTIVRPSGLLAGGIFDSERLAGQAKSCDKMDAIHWSNMITRETVVNWLVDLLDLINNGTIKPAYIFSEICQPRHEIFNQIRQQFQLPPIIVPTDAPMTGKRLVGTGF